MGFGGNLVQELRVYAWRAVPSFPQIALWGPSLAFWPQPFEIESPPAFPSVIPEFKPIVPKDDYDSDPGALDDDFVEESGVKEEKEDQLDGENQKFLQI